MSKSCHHLIVVQSYDNAINLPVRRAKSVEETRVGLRRSVLFESLDVMEVEDSARHDD